MAIPRFSAQSEKVRKGFVAAKRERLTNHAVWTARQIMFLEKYLETLNSNEAARYAGYSERSANTGAARLMALPHIKEAIQKSLNRRQYEIGVSSDEVARYWFELATADARKLSPVAWGACRHCYGVDHQYQFTQDEMRVKKQEHLAWQLEKKNANDRVPFDERGGDGFDPTKPIVLDCPECHGQGAHYFRNPDMENWTQGEAMLFAGYKIRKDGSVELKTQDRIKAMENFQLLMGFVRPVRPLLFFDPSTAKNAELDGALEAAYRKGLLSIEDLRSVGADVIDVKHEEVKEGTNGK